MLPKFIVLGIRIILIVQRFPYLQQFSSEHYARMSNGIEYEKALLVGSERRKTFALKHLNRIGRAAIFGVIITIAGILFNWSQFITFPIILISFIAACISTVNIEL